MVHHRPDSGRLECHGCGAQHVVKKSRVPERRDGVMGCPSCGVPFIEWTGPVAYAVVVGSTDPA